MRFGSSPPDVLEELEERELIEDQSDKSYSNIFVPRSSPVDVVENVTRIDGTTISRAGNANIATSDSSFLLKPTPRRLLPYLSTSSEEELQENDNSSESYNTPRPTRSHQKAIAVARHRCHISHAHRCCNPQETRSTSRTTGDRRTNAAQKRFQRRKNYLDF